jgi:glycosyltransferase involved in cell wall biosynthesis
MSSSTVSVVIPTYNRAHLVTKAVASALAQTVPPLEVIVVDDGSTDDTRTRLSPYGTSCRYLYQTNQGVSAARNLGIGEARGEFIAFLDSDDVWHPRKLEYQLRALGERPEVGLLGTGAMEWPASSFPEIATYDAGRVRLLPWSTIAVRNGLGTSSVMTRSAVLKAAGGFDPVMKGSEERDLWLRIAEVSSVAILDLPLVGWCVFAGGLGLQPDKCRAGMLRTLRKLDEKGAWKGRRWLRRKAYAYVYNACSYTYIHNHLYWCGVGNVLRSIACYPLPFGRDDVSTPFERPKRLVLAMLRILRLAAAEPGHGVATASTPARLQQPSRNEA